MKIKIGTTFLELGGPHLKEMQDSSHLMSDPDALRKEIEEKGYLFIRGLHDRQDVLEARRAVLDYIRSCGDEKLDPAYKWEEGVLDSRCGRGCVPFMEGKNRITHSETVLKVLEGHRVRNFFKMFFREPAKTFDFKWLRAMYNEGFTGAHVDNVYMSRGSSEVCTIWTPFGDVPLEMGTLAVVEGSHKLPGFKKFQSTYGNMDLEAEHLQGSGWFTEDPLEIVERFGGVWKTANFKAGDALIFTLRTVHMSTVNTTHFARISCDTRWLPGSHKADPRFVGDLKQISDLKFGVHAQTAKDEADSESNVVTMEQKKAEWGFQ
ncbi:uncharacterized protein [Oscarella lobularis]|uniref:uncharacterized protein n=1 Tax=Oscarella lobularis TaxID=121494 RepID=UPI003313409D